MARWHLAAYGFCPRAALGGRWAAQVSTDSLSSAPRGPSSCRPDPSCPICVFAMTGTQNEGAMDKDRIARNLECVEKQFHSEAIDEVEAALDLYTDDIVWDAPALNGLDRSFSGKEAVAKNYRELFASMRNVRFEFLQRFATEDRVRAGQCASSSRWLCNGSAASVAPWPSGSTVMCAWSVPGTPASPLRVD